MQIIEIVRALDDKKHVHYNDRIGNHRNQRNDKRRSNEGACGKHLLTVHDAVAKIIRISGRIPEKRMFRIGARGQSTGNKPRSEKNEEKSLDYEAGHYKNNGDLQATKLAAQLIGKSADATHNETVE